MIYALNPRNYAKHTSYIMQNNFFLKNIGKKLETKISNIEINFIKNQKKRYVLPLCDLS
jgi:hypothetical protein